ncbi:putative DsbA family dithiol-disulfide isomerase [Rhodococcus sp. OK302]|nr:putative DsbA family dithiol-disulfide isomerase [Rhodococcus sp. OK302]
MWPGRMTSGLFGAVFVVGPSVTDQIVIDQDVTGQDLTVEVWSDVACPWCYIGKTRFQAALDRFENKDRVKVIWRSYQLAPETPVGEGRTELEALVEMKGMAPDQVRQMFSSVANTAAEVGLDLDFDTAIAANTFDAHRLLHLAGDKQADLLEALFKAHFSDGKVIDDREELVRIAVSVGLDADTVRAQLASDAAADAVREDLSMARQFQVSGVPFFVANRAIAVSGAQPEEVFLQLLTQASESA